VVERRVAEELERRKDEIEAEVRRRVEEAKAALEKEMMEDLQRQRAAQQEEEKRREVDTCPCPTKSIMLAQVPFSFPPPLLVVEREEEAETEYFVVNNSDDPSDLEYTSEWEEDLFLFFLSTLSGSEASEYFALLHYNNHKLYPE